MSAGVAVEDRIRHERNWLDRRMQCEYVSLVALKVGKSTNCRILPHVGAIPRHSAVCFTMWALATPKNEGHLVP
jgi:hypothetical protein